MIKQYFVGCVAGLMALVVQAVEPYKMPAQFSAEMESKASGQTFTTRMFVDGDKTRVEATMQGMNTVSIVRKDLKKMYTLMMNQNMYMEMPLDDKTDPNKMMEDPKAKWEDMGSETVNGVDCNKIKVTSENGGAYFWYSKADKHPVRMATLDGKATTDYKNFKTGPQDASLFEPPAGFKKMEMPAGMMNP